jgi:hypothetical protein
MNVIEAKAEIVYRSTIVQLYIPVSLAAIAPFGFNDSTKQNMVTTEDYLAFRIVDGQSFMSKADDSLLCYFVNDRENEITFDFVVLDPHCLEDILNTKEIKLQNLVRIKSFAFCTAILRRMTIPGLTEVADGTLKR